MRFSLSFLVVAAMLYGCGGSQSEVTGLGTLPGIPTAITHRQKAASSQTLSGSNGDLIYATGGCGGTCVISYPAGELVGSLPHGDGGTCSDTAGNVYIPGASKLFEYPHGGTTPIATFVVSSGVIAACSIDAITNDVAVVVATTNAYNVAIFAPGNGNPVTYLVSVDAQFCGYDNVGNLFVDGYGRAGHYFKLYELPAGSSTFEKIAIHKRLLVRPGQVQWDGQHLTIEGLGITYGVEVYRLDVLGSSATVVGKTTFKGVTRTALQSWITSNKILVPYGSRGNGNKRPKIGIWDYPAGGKAQQKLAHLSPGANFQGVTFSAASE